MKRFFEMLRETIKNQGNKYWVIKSIRADFSEIHKVAKRIVGTDNSWSVEERLQIRDKLIRRFVIFAAYNEQDIRNQYWGTDMSKEWGYLLKLKSVHNLLTDNYKEQLKGWQEIEQKASEKELHENYPYTCSGYLKARRTCVLYEFFICLRYGSSLESKEFEKFFFEHSEEELEIIRHILDAACVALRKLVKEKEEIFTN